MGGRTHTHTHTRARARAYAQRTHKHRENARAYTQNAQTQRERARYTQNAQTQRERTSTERARTHTGGERGQCILSGVGTAEVADVREEHSDLRQIRRLAASCLQHLLRGMYV